MQGSAVPSGSIIYVCLWTFGARNETFRPFYIPLLILPDLLRICLSVLPSTKEYRSRNNYRFVISLSGLAKPNRIILFILPLHPSIMGSKQDLPQYSWIQQRSKLPSLPEIFSTNASQLYAAIAGGIFAIIILTHLASRLIQVLKEHALVFFLKHILYPFCLHRHLLLGPWSRASLIFQQLYWAVTIICLTYKASSLSDAGMRAGTLSLINLIPLYSGLHLSFLADVLGVSVRTYTKLHGSIGVMSGALAIFHVGVVLAGKENSSFSSASQLYGLIVSSQKTYKRFKCSLYSGRGLSSPPFNPLPPLSSQTVLRAVPTCAPGPSWPNHVLGLASYSVRRALGAHLSLRDDRKSHHHFVHTRVLDPFSQSVVTAGRRKGEDNKSTKVHVHRYSTRSTVEGACRSICQPVDAFFQLEVLRTKLSVYDRLLDRGRSAVLIFSCEA